MKGKYMIEQLRQKWMLYTIVADLLTAAGIAFLLAVLGSKFFNWPVWLGCLYFLLCVTALLLQHRVQLVNETAIAQLLDQHYPQLEESAALLLEPLSSLNGLERLQYQKTTLALSTVPSALNIPQKLKLPFFVLVTALVIGMGIYKIPFHVNGPLQAAKDPVVSRTAKPEIIPAAVAGINVYISPPLYTGKTKRRQQSFGLLAEEGSLVEWQLRTSLGAKQVSFIFNGGPSVQLKPVAGNNALWQFNKKIDSAGFYQVAIDGKVSALYSIETIRDHAPVLNLLSPKQYTTIDIGEPQIVKIAATITDDYGISDAFISATIASGSGEAVKFKEQKIALAGFIAGKTQYSLQQIVSLPALGMQAGDELYFYVQATDNHQQQTRSDIYIVHLPDTAQLMSLDGMANSLTLKPEYFRSQRQIIIETEQLLKDKDTISEDAFKNRSNNLGLDQKLLRLRYGKFLGDEAESGESNIDAVNGLADFSNAEKIRDAFTDKHDNAEDASFYDAGTKQQLRATLTEMWGSEIRLRTFTPQAALPFEYKALRLLKDLQQKSRAYVAKTNFKTTPLDLKKRLSGDLTKIDPSVLQKDMQQEEDKQLPVRNALAVLEAIRTTGKSPGNTTQLLQQASLQLQQAAIRQPVLYLPAIESFKKITTHEDNTAAIDLKDLLMAENGLQQLLAVPAQLPSANKSSTRQLLSRQYFNNLQKKQP